MANFFTLQRDPQEGVSIGTSNQVGLIGDVYRAEPTDNGIVSVINNMRFTGSDLTTYQKSRIPFCLLNEYELLTNSAVSSLLYTLQGSIGSGDLKSLGGVVGNISGGLSDATSSVKKLINPAGGAAGDLSSFQNPGGIAKATTTGEKAGKLISDFTTQLAGVLQSSINSVQDILNTSSKQTGSIKPYQNLYVTKPTGFHYTFPYYGDTKKDITSQFSVSEAGLLNNPIINKGSEFLISAVEKFAQVALFTSPGVYIERPKFYNLSDSGPAYDINFSLINTFDVKDIQRHYDFLFLLTFQNLPYRKDLARVKLPRIYSFILPGEIFLPYVYISKMAINFEGNRRIIRLTHPRGTVVDTIVPDIYNVTLTVTSLNPDAGNFMVSDKLLNIRSFFVGDEPIVQPGTILPAQIVGSVPPNAA